MTEVPIAIPNALRAWLSHEGTRQPVPIKRGVLHRNFMHRVNWAFAAALMA